MHEEDNEDSKLGNKVNIVKVFALKEHPNRAYMITQQNVHKFLNEPPYRQKDRFYALCPYCHNPICIISRSKQVKGADRPQVILYARHLVNAPEGFYPPNKDKGRNCLLEIKPNIFAPSLLKGIKVPVHRIDRQRVRKALSFLTGIYISNQLTNVFIDQHKPVLQYRLVNYYDFPFVLLIGMHELPINGRKVASKYLANKIAKNARYFYLSDNQQIIEKEPNQAWKIKLIFKEQKHDSGDMLYLLTDIVEEQGKGLHHIGSYRIYCQMFNHLIK